MPLYGEKKHEFQYVNRYVPRVDARDKVTGRAVYTADLVFPDMLLGGALHSQHPHARVLRIDTEKAKAIPGVKAVLTFQDLKKEFSWAYYTYMTERVRYRGDAVAIAAAETEDALKAALRAIEVTYEVLPAVFTTEEALMPGAPLVHEGNAECAGNIWSHSRYRVRKGDADAALDACDLVLERQYETGPVEHAYLETEAAVAVPDPTSGEMTVHAGAANPYFTRRWVADILNIPRARVRIVQETMGGSFGGKEECLGLLAARTALLAQVTGRPVKMVYSREESIAESTKRHPFTFRFKVGVSRDGKLQALKAELIENVGAYHMHEFMNFRASVHAAGVYEIPNVAVDVYGVFTNTVTSGAMRGYSSPQIIFAQEQLYEEVAEALGMDALEFKKKNLLTQGAVSPCGQTITGEVILPEMLDTVCRETDYAQKHRLYETQNGTKRKGIGLSVFYRGCGLGAESPDASAGFVCVHDDGSVMVNTGLTENGQGMKTAFTQIVAETLGVPTENIHCIGVDTHTIPDSGITAASRTTVMGAQSVKLAAEELKGYLLETAAMMFHTVPEQVELREGMFRLKADPNAAMPFQAVCNVHHWTGQQAGVMRWFKPPHLNYDMKAGGGNAFPTYAYGVVAAEVEVDTATGKITVEKVTSGHDCGTVVNPKIVEGQVYGGILMGQGFAVMENLAMRSGAIRSDNMDTYMIATSMDMPDMKVLLFESRDPAGTYGAKSVGESATEGVAAAIMNAVRNATGLRVRRIPVNQVGFYELMQKEGMRP